MITTVKLRLKELEEALPGIRRAYAQLPGAMTPVNSVDCPQFLNFAREADHDETLLGNDWVRTTRDYLLWLLVKPAVEGEEGEGESATEPWIQKGIEFFLTHRNLGNLRFIESASIIHDSGPSKLLWNKEYFWGVEFRMRVIERYPRDYAENE